MSYIALEAADAEELVELLEYITDRLDTLAEVDPKSTCRDDRWSSYDLNQLRGDLVRFARLLRACKMPS